MSRNSQPNTQIAWFYDLNACRNPTGVTRHALALRTQLSQHDHINLKSLTGRITAVEGRAVWNECNPTSRASLPLQTRTALRFWRVASYPPVELWTGQIDWLYCPAEYYVPTRAARRAVTSHDLLQDISYGGPRRKRLLNRVFTHAHLILSVSEFNTNQIRQTFPTLKTPIALVPNAADDLFFQPPSKPELDAVHADLGLQHNQPYLLSVANFQPRKNIPMLVRTAARLPEVRDGSLALVLIGTGSTDQRAALQSEIDRLPRSALVRLPGYRQGTQLRAAYAAATALVFPSTCESFGIPAVEAMAQACPVALANNTALPEIAGNAAWYFNPSQDDSLLESLRNLLDQPTQRAARIQTGLQRAQNFRWSRSCELLLQGFNSIR